MPQEPEIEDLFHDADDVVDVVTEAYERLPRDFKRQWEVFESLSSDELGDRVRADFANEPDARREILIAYLAQRLGYWRYLNRVSSLTSDPLWDLLHKKGFDRIDDGDRQLLWMIAGSTRKVRSYLEPRAALAAVALWRLDDGRMGELATELLQRQALPADERWLYDLIRELAGRATESEVEGNKHLIDLARLQNDAGFHDIAALMGGLMLTRRYDHWYTGEVLPNLMNACDEAEAEPWKNADWLNLMADATIQGELTHAWLERPMAAAIRMALTRPDREAELRAYHSQKRYDVSSIRIRHLYRTRLRAVSEGNARQGAWLLSEVERTAEHNPRRAMHLLEHLIGYSNAGSGSAGAQLVHVLELADELDPLLERLATLYVRCFALEPHAYQFVERHAEAINWSNYPDVDPADVDVYFSVADYERGFENRQVEYAGVLIDHNDKDGAAHVRYFAEKRTNPNTVTGTISNFEVPTDWLAGELGESDIINRLFVELMDALEVQSAKPNYARKVLQQFAIAGEPVDRIEEIQALPLPKIHRTAKRSRQKPMLWSAAAGAVGGALAPTTLGFSATFDGPALMYQVTQVCSQMCWYFGFDPADDPALPLTILAVALTGSRPESVNEEDVYRQFHAFLVRKSIIMAAIAQGAGTQVLGNTLVSFLDMYKSSRRSFKLSGERMLRWIRRDEDDWRSRVIETANQLALPAGEGLLGAALNLALIYDVYESAEAVLTDRYLDRKYPDWKPTW